VFVRTIATTHCFFSAAGFNFILNIQIQIKVALRPFLFRFGPFFSASVLRTVAVRLLILILILTNASFLLQVLLGRSFRTAIPSLAGEHYSSQRHRFPFFWRFLSFGATAFILLLVLQ